MMQSLRRSDEHGSRIHVGIYSTFTTTNTPGTGCFGRFHRRTIIACVREAVMNGHSSTTTSDCGVLC